jgi:tetratricopeptide (TPR) repeat protein
LAVSAKSYMMLRYKDDRALQQTFKESLLNIQAPLTVLSCNWLDFDSASILQFLSAYEPKSHQELRQWQRYLKPYLAELNTEMRLRYAVALRRLASAEAEPYLKSLIAQTGQAGDFAMQLLARYELALHFQSQAQFETALRDYETIEAYIKIQTNNKLEQNILLQRARIAIEQGNAALALNYLRLRKIEEAQDFVLESEAYLLLGENEKSRYIAQTQLKALQGNPQLAASLQTIVGRSFQAASATAQSIDYFNAALSLSEQFNSDFDIARAKTNLAGAYLAYKADYFDEADALLREAKAIQSRISDFLGLSVTEMNLSHLKGLRVTTYKK